MGLQYNEQTQQYNTTVQLPRFELPLVKVSDGTFPKASEWARNPVPACRLCDQSICGIGIQPNLSEAFKPGYWMGNGTYYGGLKCFHEEQCGQHCAGHNMTSCPPGMTQFPEPLPGISGYNWGPSEPYGRQGFPYNIVDKVEVPATLPKGDYLLSWRWDCEQTNTIWQSCADVQLLDDDTLI